MPSECFGTFGLDNVGYEDLNSPESLYPKDSVNSLLPKELQIPSSHHAIVIKTEQLEATSCNDRSLVATHDQSSCTSTTTTFPIFESNQNGLGAFDNLDLTQSKGLGVSNLAVSFPMSDSPGVQESLFQEFAECDSSSASSPAPSSCLMSPSSGYLSTIDDLDEGSLQELMSLADENSIASLAELIESEEPEKRKSRKLSEDQSPSSPSEAPESPIFDAELAVAAPTNFDFSKKTTKTSKESSNEAIRMETNVLATPIKEPSLNVPFPTKENGIEIKVIIQPETHHRARYQTEGSRGCVKDESQNGFPTVKIIGYNKPVALQVFIGNDTGNIKPHGFYQASKVCGRNNTPCEEKTIDHTTVIEMIAEPAEDMVVSVDCVGIMKLRNADVEHKGLGLPRSKKRSTKSRMVFRVNIPKDDGTYRTLQIASTQIACTQPTGMPEIMKKSLTSCSVKGGEELFVLGKNFVRGTTVKFQEICDDKVVWEGNGKIDRENFQHNHLVCRIPAYKSLDISRPVVVSLVITTGNGRESDSQQFTYTPLPVATADNRIIVDTESSEAQMSIEESKMTTETTPVETTINGASLQEHESTNNNDSSFAEQLRLVALLATGQTNVSSNTGLAQKVMSALNQHKQQQQQHEQLALLQQQQSYLVMLNQPVQRIV